MVFLAVLPIFLGKRGSISPWFFMEGPEKIGKSDVTSDAITASDI
jgi:hypothetical protein